MDQTRALSWKRKLALSAAAAGLGAGLCAILGAAGEALTRLAAPKSDSVSLGLKLENSARRYGLRPNIRAVKTGVTIEINSLGFREKEYPVERRAGVRRIAVLGDSFVFGVGVQFSDTFSKRLEAELNRAAGPFEVINFGVSGYNTTQELATLRETASAFKPDLVIVGYVLNDTERVLAGERRTRQHAGSLLDRTHVRLKEASLFYHWLSPKLGAAFGLFNARYAVGGTQQIIRSFDDGAPGWIESRHALVGIAREARALRASLLVVVLPAMLDFASYPLAPAHDKITRFCRDNAIDALDLLPRFRSENASRLAVPFDGHPNAAAHKIFADEIFSRLASNGLVN